MKRKLAVAAPLAVALAVSTASSFAQATKPPPARTAGHKNKHPGYVG
jgi:hypothetical protein